MKVSRLVTAVFCFAVSCTVVLTACKPVAPSQQRGPSSETSVTISTTSPAADAPKPIPIPPVVLPTPSSKVAGPDYCGIPGVACAPSPSPSTTTTPLTTTPATSTPDPNGPSGSDLSPTTTP
jgi:hypothetical protein